MGDETQYHNIHEEKWPQLKFDPEQYRYILTEYSGTQSIFNEQGFMIAQKDRQGRTTSFQYQGNQLTGIVYPENAFMEFQYGGNGFLSSIKDSTGRTTQLITDSSGHVREIIYPDQSRREFDYNENGLMIKDKTGSAVKTYTWHPQWPVLTKVNLPNTGQRDIDPAVLKYLLNEIESDPENPVDFPLLAENDGVDSEVTFEDGKKGKYLVGKGWKTRYYNDILQESITYAYKNKNRMPIKIETQHDKSDVTEIRYNNDLQVYFLMGKLTDTLWDNLASDIHSPYKITNDQSTINTRKLTFFYNDNHLVSKITGFDTDTRYTYDPMGNPVEIRNERINKSTFYTYDADNNLTRQPGGAVCVGRYKLS